jgi:hypothetical protein
MMLESVSWKMSICLVNDITILSIYEMVTKWGNDEKKEHVRWSLLITFSVWTPSTLLSSELFKDFSFLDSTDLFLGTIRVSLLFFS